MVSSCEQSPWACVEVTPLLLDTVFAPCVQERPLGVMARAGLARLLAAPRREALWARTAQPPDTRALLFASLGPLMREGVLGVPPPVPAAEQAHQDPIGGSPTALDQTLERVETGVAAALVRASAALAEPGVKAVRARHPRGGPGSPMQGREGHPWAPTEPRLTA